jgi:hypothetical protein
MTHSFCEHVSDEAHIKQALNELKDIFDSAHEAGREAPCTVELLGGYITRRLMVGGVLAAFIGESASLHELERDFILNNTRKLAEAITELANHIQELRQTETQEN